MESAKQRQFLIVTIKYTKLYMKTTRFDTLHIGFPRMKRDNSHNDEPGWDRATRIKSCTHFASNQNMEKPNSDSSASTLKQEQNKNTGKWAKRDFKEILYDFFYLIHLEETQHKELAT